MAGAGSGRLGSCGGDRAVGGGAEGAQLCWRAVRRRRYALDRSRPEVRLALGPRAGGNPRCCCVRVCQSPVLTPGSWRAARLSPSVWWVPLQEVARRMKVLYERVAGIDVHKDMTAPRGALLYSRFSREEFGGYSWV